MSKKNVEAGLHTRRLAAAQVRDVEAVHHETRPRRPLRPLKLRGRVAAKGDQHQNRPPRLQVQPLRREGRARCRWRRPKVEKTTGAKGRQRGAGRESVRKRLAPLVALGLRVEERGRVCRT